MKKLNISTLMLLCEKLEKTNWLCILIEMNNKKNIEKFLKMIGKQGLLQETISELQKKKIR